MASVVQNIYFARLAEQGERFEDMITYMKAVVEVRFLLMQANHMLSYEERNLLSVGYKNAVASRRQAWRTLSDLQDKEENNKGKSEVVGLLIAYKSLIEKELDGFCTESLLLLDKLTKATIGSKD